VNFNLPKALALLILFVIVSDAFAQSAADKYPLASISEEKLYEFDIARPIKHFEALADGSNWFAVDEFGYLQTIIIRGTRFERRFNEIPVQTAHFSPKGDFAIWMGLDRSYDERGFNTTKTTVYRIDKQSTTPDSIAQFTSDYNSLYFSKSGKHWAAAMPAAKADQVGVRDVVLIDGLVMSKDHPKPGMFTFDREEKNWAYRSTDGPDENLVTTYATNRMYRRKVVSPMLPSPDPVIYHFSPDLKNNYGLYESRDYDFDFPHEALMFKTSYIPERQDTTHVYIIFNNKREPNYRWINSLQIDTAGKHIVYFACDTFGEGNHAVINQKHGVLVKDGDIISKMYDETGRVSLSPSGENMAWSASQKKEVSVYLNGERLGAGGDYIDFIWSPNEKKIAYITTTEHGKPFMVANGKRSPVFDFIGRVAWSADGKSLEYCTVKYDKLLYIRQSF
jgi:hypothetical protein